LRSGRLGDSDKSTTTWDLGNSVVVARSGTRSRSRGSGRLGRLCTGVISRSGSGGGRFRVAAVGTTVRAAGAGATLLASRTFRALKSGLELGNVLSGIGEFKVSVLGSLAFVANIGNKHIGKRIQMILGAT
jgi:hypothetical protein